MREIEILDKINDIYTKIPMIEFAIHPSDGEVTNIKEMDEEYKDCGKIVTGIIFKEDGSTIVLYGKEVKWMEEMRVIVKWKGDPYWMNPDDLLLALRAYCPCLLYTSPSPRD